MKIINIYDNNKNINVDLKELEINNDELLIGLYENKFSIKDEESKNLISNLDYNLFILYDIQSENLFLINRENIVNRVISGDYRFPDLLLIKTIEVKLRNEKKI